MKEARSANRRRFFFTSLSTLTHHCLSEQELLGGLSVGTANDVVKLFLHTVEVCCAVEVEYIQLLDFSCTFTTPSETVYMHNLNRGL